MANTQAQFGFQHIGFLPGYAPDYQLATRQIQSSYATKIYFGDPVVKSSQSPYITVGLGTGNLTAVVGIFYGCTYIPSGGGSPLWAPWFPASVQADATAYIMNSPGALFRAASLLTAMPSTSLGALVGWSTGAGGSTVGAGLSTFTVDQSTLTTGSTAPFMVYSMWNGIGNGADTTTNYNWVVVAFNNQQLRAGVTVVY